MTRSSPGRPSGRLVSPGSAARRGLGLGQQLPLVGGFLLLLLVAAGSIVLVVSNHRFAEGVSRTLEVRSTAYRLLATTQDAETGERGFLLTGNPDYLRPYEFGRVEAPKALGELRRLVAGNAAQTAEMADLERAVQAKIDDLALGEAVVRAGVEPGEAAPHHLDGKVAALEIDAVDVGDLELAAPCEGLIEAAMSSTALS